MQIEQYPHPSLRWVAKPVREVTDEIRRIAREMVELMTASKGVGLAATQVALPIRLFVLNTKTDANPDGIEGIFVNPQITERKGLVEEEEGCLSLPGVFGKLKRAEKITVTATDLDGKPFELKLDGLNSRAVQHEVDHLQGVLFIDKLNPLAKIGIISKVKEFERTYRRGQEAGEIPSNKEFERQLAELEAKHC